MSSLYQSEVYIIPEFFHFNGGDLRERVSVQRLSDSVIDAGKMAIVKSRGEKLPFVISLTFNDRKCASAPIQVDVRINVSSFKNLLSSSISPFTAPKRN